MMTKPHLRQFILAGMLMTLMLRISIAQSPSHAIQILAKPKKDGVWLRWAPSNQTVWQLGNKFGFVLERFTLNAQGEIENQQATRISDTPFKPLSSDELMRLSATVEEAEVLNELIYGEGDDFNSNTSLAQLLSKKEELENKFGVALLMCDLNVEAAKAAGLFVIDQTAVKGQRYIYRIGLERSNELEVKPGVIVVDVTDEQPLPPINDVQVEFRDRSVMLSWSTLMHQGTYSLYYIERSSDGKVFKRITDIPYVHMSETDESETAFFVDSLDVNGKTYYYRIAGATPFGEISLPSNIVKGEGKNNLSGLLIIREGKIVPPLGNIKAKEYRSLKTFQVNLTWEFPQSDETQISGFVISRSTSADGPYHDINAVLDSKSRSFTDMTTLHNTYYQVRAIDNLKHEVAQSYPYLVQVEDNTPPEIPQNLLGSISKSGVVDLSWRPNKDSDLMGYRVFRSNSLKEDPVEVTTSILNQPKFIDSVNMNVLNRKIFYHLVAVDRNFNASGYSTPLILSRPDKRPPVAPVFTRIEIVKDSIVLEWQNSASDDVAKYRLLRIDEDLTRTMTTWTQSSRKNLYFDKPYIGKTYQYRIEVEDSAGNKSEVVTSKLFFEPGYRKSIEEIETSIDRAKGLIFLSWKNEGTPIKCIIYRKENEGQFRLFKTLNGTISEIIDTEVAINNVYYYRIQVVYPGGVKSILSRETVVKF